MLVINFFSHVKLGDFAYIADLSKRGKIGIATSSNFR